MRGEVTYEYEANGRLLEHNPEKRFDGEEFRYDAAGNRLNFNTSRFDRVKDNRLKKWSNHEYKYDAWGNLVEKIVGIVRWQTFTYDSENRLVKTETMANSQVESTSSYQYDSLGRRVGKQWEIKGRTDQKRFLWQGLRMLREEGPEQSSLYLYEPGSYAPLARVDQREGEAENRIYYFHTDQIGTPLEMTDAEGQIVWQAKYRPWGAIEKLVVNEVEQNLRFQGQYFDVETGLHYNTFRYYDPEIGRFITQDPIGLSGGDNLYQYAPNPNGWVDPLGWSCSTALNVNKPKILNSPSLSVAERSFLERQFAKKQNALTRAAARGDLVWSPGTHDVRISSLQGSYRKAVTARFERMYGQPPNLSKINADHPIDLIVGGSSTQRLQMLDESINKSVGSSLKNAGRKAGLKPGDKISSIIFN
ncbi:hypothetical protein ALP69_200102 [Pseudomonas syringae pv. aceris]|nr:hypothetical protein ALP69_200102 [Pseudomonas syringae pv. aceris]